MTANIRPFTGVRTIIFVCQGPRVFWAVGKSEVKTTISNIAAFALFFLKVPVPGVVLLLEKLGFCLNVNPSGFL